jgi:hypothetical protein
VVASETETPALHLLRAQYDSKDGLPQEWRMLEELDRATTVVVAVARGWVVVQAGHSISYGQKTETAEKPVSWATSDRGC